MLSVAHYIARSQSGRGIEQNLITLCLGCHAMFDHGRAEERERMKFKVKEYFIWRYGDSWREEDLRYKRE